MAICVSDDSDNLLRESIRRWMKAEEEVSHLQIQLKREQAENNNLRSRLSGFEFQLHPCIGVASKDANVQDTTVKMDGRKRIIRLLEHLNQLVMANGIDVDVVECEVQKSMLEVALSLDEHSAVSEGRDCTKTQSCHGQDQSIDLQHYFE